jgi:hypothetical protein
MRKSIVNFSRNVMQFISNGHSKIGMTLLGSYMFLFTNSAFADGEDILLEPTRNLFATFVGTGCNLLLLMEVCATGYCLTTQRKVTGIVILPILIALTTWAKVKFGG